MNESDMLLASKLPKTETEKSLLATTYVTLGVTGAICIMGMVDGWKNQELPFAFFFLVASTILGLTYKIVRFVNWRRYQHTRRSVDDIDKEFAEWFDAPR